MDYELVHTEDFKGGKAKLYVAPEWVHVRGNLIVSGDDDFDKQEEDKVLQAIADGDTYAWFTAKVTFEANDLELGADYMGCCNYDNLESFLECSFSDMRDEAYSEALKAFEAMKSVFMPV